MAVLAVAEVMTATVAATALARERVVATAAAEATAGDMAKGAAVPVMEAVMVRAVTATVEATY